jgi:hypothetical protein
MKIDVKDFSAHRVVLDVLNKRQPAFFGTGGGLDFEIDKQVFARSMRENLFDLPAVHFEIGWKDRGTVDVCRHRTARADGFDCIGACFSADCSREFCVVGHGILEWKE